MIFLFSFSCPDTVFLKLLPLGWKSLHCCVPCLFCIVLFHTCHRSHHGRLMAGEIQVSEDISLIQSACIDTVQPVQGQCCVCSQFWASSECSKDTLVKVSSSLLTELICLLMLFCAPLHPRANRQQSWDKLNVTSTLFLHSPSLPVFRKLRCRATSRRFAKVCLWEGLRDSEEAMSSCRSHRFRWNVTNYNVLTYTSHSIRNVSAHPLLCPRNLGSLKSSPSAYNQVNSSWVRVLRQSSLLTISCGANICPRVVMTSWI